MPWIILSVCVFLWGLPQVRAWLDGRGTVWSVEIPELHGRVYRDISVLHGSEKAEEAVFRLNWLSATGMGIFVAAILSAMWLRMSPYRVARCFWRTLIGLRWALATIAAMLAIAFVTRYSGTDVILGLAFTRTGVFYPFFAPLLGWLGVALTGSDTSSNALFGSLQRFTAERLGLNPVLICTANSTGGVMGKMIDAQSIVVSAAATNQYGDEGKILRFVFWHSVALAFLMGFLTLAQAYVLRWMVPGG
jgi:lactate permease